MVRRGKKRGNDPELRLKDVDVPTLRLQMTSC